MHALEQPVEEIVNELLINCTAGSPQFLNNRRGNLHGEGLHADLRFQESSHVLLEHLQVRFVSDELVWVLVDHCHYELGKGWYQVAHALFPICFVLNDGISQCLVDRVHGARISNENGVELESISNHVGDILHNNVVEWSLQNGLNVIKHFR